MTKDSTPWVGDGANGASSSELIFPKEALAFYTAARDQFGCLNIDAPQTWAPPKSSEYILYPVGHLMWH